MIRVKLGPKITEPPGFADIVELRLLTSFTGVTTSEMREAILHEFSKPDSNLRVVIASSAFGMGVNIPDISRIINWGLPPTLEDLAQQTGRAGRNGLPADAILYNKSTQIHQNWLKVMQQIVVLCRR